MNDDTKAPTAQDARLDLVETLGTLLHSTDDPHGAVVLSQEIERLVLALNEPGTAPVTINVYNPPVEGVDPDEIRAIADQITALL